MFEKDLKEKIEKIFDMRVTYDEPGESDEQEKLFVEITRARPKIKDGSETAMVEAQVSIFGNSDKMTFGFFMKQLDKADPVLKSKFFFFDLEQNARVFGNISQRSFSLVYFYSGQYDPEQGSITSIQNSIEVES